MLNRLTVVADRGYYKELEILACEQAGITTFVPKLAVCQATLMLNVMTPSSERRPEQARSNRDLWCVIIDRS